MSYVRLVTLNLDGLGALGRLAVAGAEAGAPLARGIRPDLPPGCAGAVLLRSAGPADVVLRQHRWAGPGPVRG